MPAYVLTQYQGMILGPIAKVLGYIINAIYNFLEVIGIPNIGLSIILFTVIVNVLMIPLTIKQQKFQKMTARMNPELQAVQKKYKNKKIKLFLIDNGGESYKYANEDSIYGNLISVADYLETGKMY